MLEKDDLTVMHDPYRRCEGSCTHDLARAVLVSELLDGDGPFSDSHPLLAFRASGRSDRYAMPAAS